MRTAPALIAFSFSLSDNLRKYRSRVSILDLQKKIAATVNDHIEAISQRSDNQVFVLPMVGDLPEHIRLEAFDAVIVHYTLIMCSDCAGRGGTLR